MERLLRNDTSVKIISVALAVFLWFYVMMEQGPATVARSFNNRPVKVSSLDEGLAVVNIDPAVVTITVQGPADVIQELAPADIVPTITLSQAEAGPVVADVQVIMPQGIQLVEVMPEQVITLVEPVQETAFPVQLAVSGRVAPDHRAGEPRLLPEQVLVRGADSLVSRVERVVANVDIGEATETVRTDLQVYAIDASGRQVGAVQLLPRQVQVTVSVAKLPPIRTLPIRPEIIGEPAEGYERAGDPVVRPGEAVFRASPGTLDGVLAATTEPVSIEGATGPVQLQVRLLLPEGVERIGPEVVTVYVPVRKVIP